jgi:2-iminoacetate synthase ThiH
VDEIKSLIEETGREPVERDTLYNRINQIEVDGFID